MKTSKSKISVRRIHFDEYTFEIENVKGIKQVWLRNEEYCLNLFILGMKATYEQIESIIFSNYMEYIEEYKERFEDEEEMI